MADLFVRGGTIVDAKGLRPGDVLVRDGRIVDVGEVRGATDEPVLSATGMFVTPGLIDCHIHLCYAAGPDPRAMAAKTDAELALEVADHARATLHGGITTARDCGGRGFVETRLRDGIRSGVVEGPRLFTSGHPIAKKGGHMSYYARQTTGPEDCAQAAREQIAGGADWLKVVATGGITSPNVDPRVAELTEAMIRAVVEEGRKAGRPVASHAHGGDGIRNSLAAGVRSVEHGTFADDAMIRAMAAEGVFLVPTLVATRAMIDAGTAKGVPEYAVAKAEQVDGERRKTFAMCVQRGVPIAMGTDAGTPFNAHGENARELELMVEAGMSPRQSVVAATATAAKLLGAEQEVGLLAPGLAGDLLVVRGNPFDDVSTFRLRLAAVVQAGRVVARP